MPSSKRKPVDEARKRLNEKLADVHNQTQHLHDVINNISKEAILNAETVLKETSKNKFLNKYVKVSQELESCLNRLLLLSDSVASIEGESDEDDSEESEEDDKEDDNESCVSATTNTSTVHKSSPQGSVVTTTTVTYEKSISCDDNAKLDKMVNDATCANVDALLDPCNPAETSLMQRHDSRESLFSSVSMITTPERKVELTDTSLIKDVSVKAFKWESDVVYPVFVTNVITPWEFHIQLLDSENDIMEQLCMRFMKEATKGYKGGIDQTPPVGVFCCAKSPIDEVWYRAEVIEVLKDSSTKDFIKVRLIDEGYDTFVGLSALRRLEEKYATLPCQAVKCILGGIQPFSAMGETKPLSFHDCNSMWSDKSIQWFNEVISSKSIFAAYFYYPPKASYDPPHNVAKDVLVCDLYLNELDTNITWGKLSYNRPPIEHHIGYKMILESNFAAHCPFFNSELNRKKSQRSLQQAKEDKENIPHERKSLVNKDPFVILPGVVNALSAPKDEPETMQSSMVRESTISPLPEISEIKSPNDKSEIKSAENKGNIKSPENKTNKKSSKNKANKKSPKNEAKVQSKNSSSKPCNFSATPSIEQEFFPKESVPTDVKVKKEEHQNVDSNKLMTQADCAREGKEESHQTNDKQKKKELDNVKVKKENSEDEKSSIPENLREQKTYDFGDTFRETEFVIDDAEGFAKILISEVVDPGLFYVHLIRPEVVLLDKMMHELNSFYDKEGESIREFCRDISYKVGMCVVAKFSADNRWYRGIIVFEKTEKNIEYNVLHVDFGSSEWITEEQLLPVCKFFCELPMETIPCSLADVEPLVGVCVMSTAVVTECPAGNESEDDMLFNDAKPASSKWSESSINKLKVLAQNQLPLMVSLKSGDKTSDGLYEIYLYDTMFDKDEFINKLLYDDGLVSSNVYTKTVPCLRLSELELENEATESDAMDIWDPMKEQYLSKRNAYSVNIDDPGVALLGYVDKKKDICINFSRRGHCYRGKHCRFLHAYPDDPSVNAVEVYCDNTVTELPDVGDWVPITVTALFDPTHFWVIFPYGLNVFAAEQSSLKRRNPDENDLENLVDGMNDYYSHMSKDHNTDLTILAEGELVAARYHDDERWYRARVVNTAEDLTQVFFIDYGNTDVVTEDNVRNLLPDFLHLPQQAIECFLNGTEFEPPVKENQLKYDTLRNKFRDLTADKVLMAHIISRAISQSMVVELYDTSTHPNTHINRIVRGWEGIARKKEAQQKYNPAGRIMKKNLTQFVPG